MGSLDNWLLMDLLAFAERIQLPVVGQLLVNGVVSQVVDTGFVQQLVADGFVGLC